MGDLKHYLSDILKKKNIQKVFKNETFFLSFANSIALLKEVFYKDVFRVRVMGSKELTIYN